MTYNMSTTRNDKECSKRPATASSESPRDAVETALPNVLAAIREYLD